MNRCHEQAVERIAKDMGFKQVSISSALVPMVRAVPRGLTATVDAYLTPVIREYLSGFLSGTNSRTRSQVNQIHGPLAVI